MGYVPRCGAAAPSGRKSRSGTHAHREPAGHVMAPQALPTHPALPCTAANPSHWTLNRRSLPPRAAPTERPRGRPPRRPRCWRRPATGSCARTAPISGAPCPSLVRRPPPPGATRPGAPPRAPRPAASGRAARPGAPRGWRHPAAARAAPRPCRCAAGVGFEIRVEDWESWFGGLRRTAAAGLPTRGTARPTV